MNETIKNLAKAFIGESQARNRYRMYANMAKKEGYEYISQVFTITAENEWEHGNTFFKFIQQIKKETKDNAEMLTVEAMAPTVLGNTVDNLKAAMEGEHEENSVLYPNFADIAEKEGYKEMANQIRAIAQAELHHEKRYKKLLDEVKKGTHFKKDKEVVWECMECGYLHTGKEPPELCPSCKHAKSFFKVNKEDL
ncbi:MAG: rubrerythrin family protein [Candidatus Lokiarchaeota archaeon]|nr:rubrerythrin family protein [Candidatus Lokiarchaeota archaeon]